VLTLDAGAVLLCYKLKYPENFFLLRGNHECSSINRIYGFYDECKRRYSIKLWRKFGEVFNVLPVAAIIEDKILCMHGGLSQELTDLDLINQIRRPADVPDEGTVFHECRRGADNAQGCCATCCGPTPTPRCPAGPSPTGASALRLAKTCSPNFLTNTGSI